MRIIVNTENTVKQIDCAEGETLLNVLRTYGYAVGADCNGRGTCGKCTVTVCGGEYGADGKTVLACKTEVFEGCEVLLRERRGGGLVESSAESIVCDGEDGYGLAVDIGTTTLAFAFVRLTDGKTICRKAELNRQQAFGADVVSRIQSATDGNADKLCGVIREQINANIRQTVAEYGLPQLKKLFVCGNTTMLHLFCNESVEGLGQYPFCPVFTNMRKIKGKVFGIDAEEITVLPSVSAFVGADITAGAIASGADTKDALLVDIGTNGEMMINAAGKILCTSTAAGPCFEGANIECGMGGVAGAIDSFACEDGRYVFTTVENAPPRGICGSGLVDAVAVMLDKKIIDGTGAFAEDSDFVLTGDIRISQKDVRNFQLAKSAIFSGMEILAKRVGRLPENEKNILIAGGLGFYLSGCNARKTGLLPKVSAQYQKVIGNAALAGTIMCMLSRDATERAVRFAEKAEYVDLSADSDFMEAFINNMSFKGYE